MLSEPTKEKARVRASLWYKQNKKKVSARLALKQLDPEFKAKKSEYDKKRRHEKSEKIRSNFLEWYSTNKNSIIRRAKVWKKANPLSVQYNAYRERAKKKGMIFQLEREEFNELIQMDCVYCGFPNPLGLDRIDSSQGYTVENSVPCCKVCNYMKLNHPLEEFVYHMKRILKHLDV